MLPDAAGAARHAERELMRVALVASLHGVFVTSAVIVASAFAIAAFWLPRAGSSPPAHACDAETGERVLAAEIATLDAEHEPAAVRD